MGTRNSNARADKKDHNIPKMFSLIRKAIEPYPKAMLFEIYDKGYRSVFEQLVACILSIRTRDETSLKASLRVFSEARNAKELLKFDIEDLGNLIKPCTFPFQKAKTLLEISQKIQNDYNGNLPCNFETLTALPGVGPKCANLVLGIACQFPAIGVDVHVHRITNRWGYIQASTPEKTMLELEKKLPQSRWVEINELLVPFGKHICTGVAPKCPTCPVLQYCQQVGVQSSQTKKKNPVHHERREALKRSDILSAK